MTTRKQPPTPTGLDRFADVWSADPDRRVHYMEPEPRPQPTWRGKVLRLPAKKAKP